MATHTLVLSFSKSLCGAYTCQRGKEGGRERQSERERESARARARGRARGRARESEREREGERERARERKVVISANTAALYAPPPRLCLRKSEYRIEPDMVTMYCVLTRWTTKMSR